MRIKRFFKDRFQRWLKRRLPPVKSITLDQRKLFIFPSRTGFGFLLVLVVLWLTATNYENNLLFAVCYLLTSFFIIAIYHTHQNLSGLNIRVLPVAPVFAGDRCEVTIQLSIEKQSLRSRPAIALQWYQVTQEGLDQTIVTVPKEKSVNVHLYLLANNRGWINTPRITLQSIFPFGWLRCWTHLAFSVEGLVYPKPLPAGVLPFFKSAGDNAHVALQGAGDDDFAGHSAYQKGMPLQRVDWKIWARGGEMFVKDYASGVDERLWLDWDYLSGLDMEQRLSRLCDWVLQADRRNLQYGLRLPGCEVSPGRGDFHRCKILKQLALFGLDHEGRHD